MVMGYRRGWSHLRHPCFTLFLVRPDLVYKHVPCGCGICLYFKYLMAI